MPGRGEEDKYTEKAVKQAKKLMDEHFHDASDEVKAAAVSGVLEIYAHNVVPSYIMVVEGEY